MIAEVTYMVPVTVIVDTDELRVLRVIVADECAELSADAPVTDRQGVIVDAATTARAIEVADEAEWPGWEFG